MKSEKLLHGLKDRNTFSSTLTASLTKSIASSSHGLGFCFMVFCITEFPALSWWPSWHQWNHVYANYYHLEAAQVTCKWFNHQVLLKRSIKSSYLCVCLTHWTLTPLPSTAADTPGSAQRSSSLLHLLHFLTLHLTEKKKDCHGQLQFKAVNNDPLKMQIKNTKMKYPVYSWGC